MATIPPNPDWFVYNGPIVSNWVDLRLISGVGTVYASHVPGTWYFNAIDFPVPVAFKNIIVCKSLSASVPAATSAASTGSEGYTLAHSVAIFQRQDYGANSTNLSCVLASNAGITASLGYSGTSQQFGMSWLTDASGGTSAFTTTSNAGNWSSYATGAKFLSIPVSSNIAGSGVTLPAGAYYIAHHQTSSSATSNSNVTLLSASGLNLTYGFSAGLLGQSASVNSNFVGIGEGAASTANTTGTMAASVISANQINFQPFVLSNA